MKIQKNRTYLAIHWTCEEEDISERFIREIPEFVYA